MVVRTARAPSKRHWQASGTHKRTVPPRRKLEEAAVLTHRIKKFASDPRVIERIQVLLHNSRSGFRAPRVAMNTVEDVYSAYPGARTRATFDQIRQFKRTIKRHGYEVRFVDELEDGLNGVTRIDEKVVYLTRDANQATLIDEYAHVWNQTQGRGRYLD
ncbi:MAG TPA: hypothetical protein DCY79_23875, partial [Planctomycetaceae bacterium]|nr:hypothetical protein [Planctomycetaceae bacterium]